MMKEMKLTLEDKTDVSVTIESMTEFLVPECLPNRLAFGYEDESLGRTGALIVAKSKTGNDYAISKTALEYIAAAEEEGRIAIGFIALVDQQRRVQAYKRATEVAALLKNVEWQEGRYGKPFVWLDQDFRPPGGDRPF